jgi:Na+/proline symporter
MRPLDIAVIAAYCAAVIVFGLVLSGRQRDASDYFLGHRGLPWWAIMLSIVATETSALTIISVPGLAARGDLTFLQLSFGYLVGRIGVAAFLLPGYFEGTQDTAYQRLERRFGAGARRTASGVASPTASGSSPRRFRSPSSRIGASPPAFSRSASSRSSTPGSAACAPWCGWT